MKEASKWIAGLVGVLALLFVLNLTGLGFTKFFGPKRENIRREIFEETKSFVHGKTQDLARLYEQHQAAETENDRVAIKAIVRMQFADFDAGDIRSIPLARFLVEMRGY